MAKKKRKTKEEKIAEAEATLAAIRVQIAEGKAADPFWYYQPSDGTISEEGKAFLRKYLHEDDIPQRLDGQLDAHLCTANIICVNGGNQCLGGETLIYDPVLKKSRQVSDIDGPFHVYAWDGEEMVIAEALKPFTKPVDDLYEIGLSNGETFVASMNHLILTQKGYQPLSELPVGASVFRSESSWDTYQSIRTSSAPSSLKKALGFLGCYLAYPRSYGGQLLSWLNNDQAVSPLQDGVQGHISRNERLDVLDNMKGDSHSYLWSCLPSSRDALSRLVAHAFDFLSHASCRLWRFAYPTHPAFPRLHGASIYQPQPSDVFARQAKYTDSQPFPSSYSSSSTFIPSLDVISITHKRRDYKWDFTVPKYHNYLCAGAIHHNSGKTTWETVEDIIFVTGQLPKSLEGVYPEEKMPTEWPSNVRVTGVSDRQVNNTVKHWYRYWFPKDYLKDRSWDKSYSAAYDILTVYDSPAGDKVIGTIEFMNNKQDVEVFQGPPKAKMSYDEEPRQDIRKENLLRMVTAKKVRENFAFTPTKGLSWTADLFIDCNDDKGKSVERFQLCSLSNPKADLGALKEICDEITDYEELKMRLLGEFVSLSGLVYGKLFDRKIHVIPAFFEGLSWEKKQEYLCLSGWDPHLVTPSAGVFMLVDREGNEYIDRCYAKTADTEDIRTDFHQIVKENGYRMGWSVADKSSNSSIIAFGGRNIYKELSQGAKCIPALRTSEKYEGSIKAGVDDMKKKLKTPSLFIVDRPENQPLIQSFRTLEREVYANEDAKGPKDKIAEGKHHHHAALRYLHQYPILWYPAVDNVPEASMFDEAAFY